MTRLLHLTDLHFGAERADLIDPMARAIEACNADFIAVSGDLTHRARPAQFRAAMAVLDRLGKPFLAAPGNHDVPLWNLPLRLVMPFDRWRHGIPPARRGAEASAGGFRLFTANTADPLRVRSGVLRHRDVERIERALRQATPARDRLNVLICHHPIEEPPGFDRGETRNAAEGIARLVRAGLDIVLTGHLHHWQIGLGITPDTPRKLLQVQSGTALCARPGEKEHGFSVIERTESGLSVTPWIVDEAQKRFHPAGSDSFRRTGQGWLPTGDSQPQQKAPQSATLPR